MSNPQTTEADELTDMVAKALYELEWEDTSGNRRDGHWPHEDAETHEYWLKSAREAIAIVRQWDAGK